VQPFSRPRFEGIAIFLLVFAGCFPAGTPAQESPVAKPDQANLVNPAKPAWVIPQEVDITTLPSGAKNAGSEYYFLAENQYDVASETVYRRYISRFNSESGLQDGSQLEITYDPSYESVKIHSLIIHRDGSRQDRLSTQEFKVIQREQDHERQLYDSDLSVIALIEDTRVGDILEYSYSVTGTNPLFSEEIYWNFDTSYEVPVGRIHAVLRVPGDREIQVKSHRSEVEPKVQSEGAIKIYRWDLNDVQPQLSDGDLPWDHDPWGWVEVSSWLTWGDVADWSLGRYVIPHSLPEELNQKVAEIRKIASPESQIQAALRFAQDEIRYLGTFDGVHSHQPHSLDTILKRRFGDCKDKSLLLTTVLRELGFTAHPALVDTDSRHGIADWASSPFAFDHIVVALDHEGRRLWLDPTNSYQRGPLTELYFPDYGYALLVADETTELTKITPQGYSQSKIRVDQTFRLPAYRGEVTLDVKTIYEGEEADSMRSYFASTSTGTVAQEYLNYYADIYPEIESTAAVTWSDDEKSNRLTVEERYRIPELWEKGDTDEDPWEATFESGFTYSRIAIPSTKERTMPFAIPFPSKVDHHLSIHLPDSAFANAGDAAPVSVDDPAFRFHFKEKTVGNRIDIVFSYESLADRVPPSEARTYLKNARKAEENTTYYLTIPTRFREEGGSEPSPGKSDKNAAEPGYTLNWPLLSTILMSALAGGLFACLAYHWNLEATVRSSSPFDRHLNGLNGWLVFIGIGVVLGPLVSLGQLISMVIDLDLLTWNQLTIPGGDTYHWLWAPLMLMEFIFQSVMVPWLILLAILFFQKRTSFPVWYIVTAVLTLAYEFIDTIGLFLLKDVTETPMAENIGSLSGAIISSIIWVIYFLVSRRSAATFRNRVDGSIVAIGGAGAAAGSPPASNPPPLPGTPGLFHIPGAPQAVPTESFTPPPGP
jgi:Domain of Unknown Function with PDB structure (DUF3857)/Protein of unknown function (DUF2569)